MLKNYLKEIHGVERQGDAREESFYPALKQLIEYFAKDLGKAHIHVTQNPRGTETHFLEEAGSAERKTAAEYLRALEKIDLLKSHKIGKENFFLNVPLYALLTG